MKRYECEDEAVMNESSNVEWTYILSADFQAWALELRGIAEMIGCVISGVRCGKCHSCVARTELIAKIDEARGS